jgi:excisionase family DNA binding protein
VVSHPATSPRPGRRSDVEGTRERFVTQREAAGLVGCSKDTIVRARRAGRLPHASLDGHTWTVPVDDLVAAGLYDEAVEDRAAPRSPRTDADAKPVSMELARAQTRIAALEELVARQDDELRFLRQLTVDSVGRRAAS